MHKAVMRFGVAVADWSTYRSVGPDHNRGSQSVELLMADLVNK